MNKKQRTTIFQHKELVFQVILHLIIFVFYSFDKHHPHIEPYKYFYFLSYTLAAFVINYVLLPRFFYSKKYIQFAVYLLLVIGWVILIEEAVLERIYFPDTRGKHFPGFFYCMLDTLPIITIISGFKFAWDALTKQREVDELKDVVKESELLFLKSQINPHFLFNNLHNLYSYAIVQSPKTPEIILELSSVLRYMLYECKEKDVPLKKEMEQLENFINLYELQIEERGNVQFHVKNINAPYRIAPLILIVFIENAFKHSTASQSDKILIEVNIELKENGILNFLCRNSYTKQSNTDSLSQGIGLENVKKRLRLLYPDAHQLNINQEEEIYEVHLTLKLNKE